jgi:putative ABC transport system ATP-binding protein
MVTHDPTAAAYASRVIFLSDGRIIDELRHADAAAIIDKMQRLDG